MYRLDEISTASKGFHYLASPYSLNGTASEAVRQANYAKTIDAMGALMRMGLNVFSPVAHWHDVSAMMPNDEPRVWLSRCSVFLRDAESLIVLTTEGWDVSAGVQWEIAYAENNNIPVLYVATGKK